MVRTRKTAPRTRNCQVFQSLVSSLEDRLPPLQELPPARLQLHFAKQQSFEYPYSGARPDLQAARRAIPTGARVGCGHPDFHDAAGADILIASSALQFIEETVMEDL